MFTLQESYRQFESNRFVYQVGSEAAVKAPEAPMDKPKQPEAGVTSEKPESIDNRVAEFNKKADRQMDSLQLTTDERKPIEGLKKGHEESLNKAKEVYGKKEAELNAKLEERKNYYNGELENLIRTAKSSHGGTETVQIAAQPDKKAITETKTESVASANPAEAVKTEKADKEAPTNDPKEALTRILFNQGKFKEMLAPTLGISAGANLETFQQALNKGDFGKALDNCINNLSKEAKDGLAKEGKDYKMGEKDIAAIGKSFKDVYGIKENIDTKEVEFINKLEVGYDKDTKPFSEVFGKDVATSLSMKYKIEEGSTKGTIKIGEEDGKTVTDVIHLLPDNIRAKYGELFKDGKPKEMKPEEREKIKGELGKMGTDEAITAARMAQVEKALLSPEGVAGLKGMKPMELIATLMQLWSVAKKAMETSDFSTLGDMMGDLSSGKNPMESMKEAENTYKQKIEGINDPNQLVDLYTDPNGTKVTEMFGEGARYKGVMKDMIEKKMEGALNIDITKIEKDSAGGTRISGKKDEKGFEITIGQDNKMQVVEIETKDDKETRKDLAVATEPFNELAGANSMAERFQNALKNETPVVAQAETPATPAAAADAQPTKPAAAPDAGKVADNAPAKPKDKAPRTKKGGGGNKPA
jgi:hypothetical protein